MGLFPTFKFIYFTIIFKFDFSLIKNEINYKKIDSIFLSDMNLKKKQSKNCILYWKPFINSNYDRKLPSLNQFSKQSYPTLHNYWF